jgi:hypothetical protein
LKLCRYLQQDTQHIWKKDQKLKTFLKIIPASTDRELNTSCYQNDALMKAILDGGYRLEKTKCENGVLVYIEIYDGNSTMYGESKRDWCEPYLIYSQWI